MTEILLKKDVKWQVIHPSIPATKSGGELCYSLRNFERLSIRISIRLSILPSVRPSVSAPSLVSAPYRSRYFHETWYKYKPTIRRCTEKRTVAISHFLRNYAPLIFFFFFFLENQVLSLTIEPQRYFHEI